MRRLGSGHWPLGFAIVFIAVTLAASVAGAHAHLDRSSPADGATVAAAPRQVEIVFSEAVEPAFSAIEVTDGTGGRVDQGKAEGDPTDAKILRVGLKASLPAGIYNVVWRVASADTHKSHGSFSFTVAP